MKLTGEKLAKYTTTIEKLQSVWSENFDNLHPLHFKDAGIRSTQVGALVMLLIELGIIK